MIFWIIAVLVTLLSIGIIAYPLFGGSQTSASTLDFDKEIYKARLKEIDESLLGDMKRKIDLLRKFPSYSTVYEIIYIISHYIDSTVNWGLGSVEEITVFYKDSKNRFINNYYSSCLIVHCVPFKTDSLLTPEFDADSLQNCIL